MPGTAPEPNDAGEWEQGPSRVFFPLRSSVELFDDPRSPSAVEKAKLAALVFDELLFEEGLLDVTLSTDGGMAWWQPPQALTPEIREQARKPIPVGAPVTLSFGVQPGRGLPPKEMRPMIQGSVTRRFYAEWHTSVTDDLAELDVDWASWTGTGHSSSGPPVEDHSKSSDFRSFIDRGDRTLLPNTESWERDFIINNFNRDAAFAATLGAAVTVTPLFAQMMDRRELEVVQAGAHAMEIALPDVTGLPWEAIARFREHPGSVEARRLLRTCELAAAAAAEPGSSAYTLELARQVTSAFADALADQRPDWKAELASEAGKFGVSMIPAAGPILEKGATVAQIAVEAYRDRRSWQAAMIQLRGSGSVAD